MIKGDNLLETVVHNGCRDDKTFAKQSELEYDAGQKKNYNTF